MRLCCEARWRGRDRRWRNWIELKSLLAVVDGAVVLVLCIVNGAPIVQGDNVFGVQPDCLAVVGYRAVGLAQFVQVESAAEIYGGKIVPLQLPRRDHRRAGGNRSLTFCLLTGFPLLGGG